MINKDFFEISVVKDYLTTEILSNGRQGNAQTARQADADDLQALQQLEEQIKREH